MFVYGVSGGAFPARQHIEASKAIARLHRLDPERVIFAEQSEEAIAAGAFHNDVVAVANERVLFAHEQAFADKDALIAACERLVPGFEYVEVPAAEVPLGDAIRSYLFNAQLVTPPDGETTLIVPTRRAKRRRSGGGSSGMSPATARSAGRGGRRAPVDGQRRRARLPAPARRRRSGDVDPRFLVDDASSTAIADVVRRTGRSDPQCRPAEPALIADIEAARARSSKRSTWASRARLSPLIPETGQKRVLTRRNPVL
jgi:succinylarginine dihydrolase